jgi:hypothetical protein
VEVGGIHLKPPEYKLTKVSDIHNAWLWTTFFSCYQHINNWLELNYYYNYYNKYHY